VNVTTSNFDLPDELIAQEPPAERGGSRLMVSDRASGRIDHRRFDELPQLLRAGDVLVVNDTRVFPAATDRRATAGRRRGRVFPGSSGDPSRIRGSRWFIRVSGCAKARGWIVGAGGAGPVLNAEIVGRIFMDAARFGLWAEDGSSVRDVD
jgi:hypothetical protein